MADIFERNITLENGEEVTVVITEGTGVYFVTVPEFNYTMKMYGNGNRDGRFNFYNVDKNRMPLPLKNEDGLRKLLNEVIELYLKK